MSQRSSFPIGKVLAGCGCLAFTTFLIIGGVVLAGGYFAFTKAEEAGIGDLVKDFDSQLESAKSEGVDGARGKLEEEAKKKAGPGDISPEDMLSWPNEPLSKKEIKKHIAFMKAWENSKATKEMRANKKTMLELADKKESERGALDTIRQINATKNVLTNTVQSQEELEKLSKKFGGTSAVLRRYFQVIAVSGAASGVTTKQDIKTLSSDATAKAMLKEHDARREDFRIWRKVNLETYRAMITAQTDPELMEKLSDDPDFKQSGKEQKRLQKVQQKNPGALVLGKLPTTTIKTWSGLSESQREDLLSTYNTLPFLPLMMFAMPEKFSAKQMAKQIMVMEYSDIMRQIGEENEAAKKKQKQ